MSIHSKVASSHTSISSVVLSMSIHVVSNYWVEFLTSGNLHSWNGGWCLGSRKQETRSRSYQASKLLWVESTASFPTWGMRGSFKGLSLWTSHFSQRTPDISQSSSWKEAVQGSESLGQILQTSTFVLAIQTTAIGYELRMPLVLCISNIGLCQNF